jgi:hypothetical protein
MATQTTATAPVADNSAAPTAPAAQDPTQGTDVDSDDVDDHSSFYSDDTDVSDVTTFSLEAEGICHYIFESAYLNPRPPPPWWRRRQLRLLHLQGAQAIRRGP